MEHQAGFGLIGPQVQDLQDDDVVVADGELVVDRGLFSHIGAAPRVRAPSSSVL